MIHNEWRQKTLGNHYTSRHAFDTTNVTSRLEKRNFHQDSSNSTSSSLGASDQVSTTLEGPTPCQDRHDQNHYAQTED